MCLFCAMRAEVSRDAVRKEFVSLLQRYPKVVPILRDAFARGRVIGSVYNDSLTGSRCVLGWAAFVYPQAAITHSLSYTALEYFVSPVRPSETPETSAELAFLLSVMDEEEAHPLPEVPSVAALPSAPLFGTVAWAGFDERISNARRVATRSVPVILPDGRAVWEERELVAT